jgi:hypothetical protein
MNIKNQLPEIESIKWRRYKFESENRYYVIILQQNLFHGWSIIKYYGGKFNKLGNMKIEIHMRMLKIKLKNKRKSKKYILNNTRREKLGVNFKKISLFAENMV